MSSISISRISSLSGRSGSVEISALRPRPSGRLVICQNLLCKLQICFGAARFGVVEKYRLTVTWCFCKANVSGNGRVEDEAAIKTSEVCRNCGSQIGAFVIHRQQEAFDLQLRVDDATQTSECIEELGNSFQSVIFA